MFTALIQMSLLIACGAIWKNHAPSHISSLAHRRALTDLVYYILLPALVLDVIWRTPLNSTSLQISFIATCGIITGLIAMWLVLKLLKANRQQTGALLLAASFPNSTYLGLPVLDQVLGSHTRSTALQYDLFACTPILLSFGMLLAQFYGGNKTDVHPIQELLKVPPLWAVSIGITLNLIGIPQPDIIHSGLSLLAGGVVPLMLIVLGMSIRWHSLHLRFLRLLLPVVLISLILVPLSVLGISHTIGMTSELNISVVLIAAMPTMVFGIVICERYQLDSELYAAAVALTTIMSLLTLPVWFQLLSVS
ncbi:MAG: AEC family transporter [Gammaproteobacteria bacterium]|nr:MAG: AEC family transporter [Gammaproteobacteria bacterium]